MTRDRYSRLCPLDLCFAQFKNRRDCADNNEILNIIEYNIIKCNDDNFKYIHQDVTRGRRGMYNIWSNSWRIFANLTTPKVMKRSIFFFENYKKISKHWKFSTLNIRVRWRNVRSSQNSVKCKYKQVFKKEVSIFKITVDTTINHLQVKHNIFRKRKLHGERRETRVLSMTAERTSCKCTGSR